LLDYTFISSLVILKKTYNIFLFKTMTQGFSELEEQSTVIDAIELKDKSSVIYPGPLIEDLKE